jgi:two-component system competent response regulator ComA
MREELTERERRVVELVSRGRTNREIADRLQLSPEAIEWTLTDVYRKLNLGSRTELALRFHEPTHPGLDLD